jgi:hypothetical protein
MPRDELRDTSILIGDLIKSLSDEEFDHLLRTDGLDDYVNDGLAQHAHQGELMSPSDAWDEEYERRNAAEIAELEDDRRAELLTDDDWDDHDADEAAEHSSDFLDDEDADDGPHLELVR